MDLILENCYQKRNNYRGSNFLGVKLETNFIQTKMHHHKEIDNKDSYFPEL